MADPKQVLTEPWDVNRRLAQLGLTVPVLTKAVRKAQSAWASCTENDPPTFAGTASWAAAVRCLREDLGIEGWASINDVNQPMIVSADGGTALTSTSANENTGRIAEFDPKTNSCKGPRTVEKVKENASGWLFHQLEEDEKAKIETAHRRKTNTWMLLIHRDVALGQVRSELSRPIKLDQEGHIAGWSERIILPPVDFDLFTEELPDSGSGDDGAIDIEIKRRA